MMSLGQYCFVRAAAAFPRVGVRGAPGDSLLGEMSPADPPDAGDLGTTLQTKTLVTRSLGLMTTEEWRGVGELKALDASEQVSVAEEQEERAGEDGGS